MIDNNTQNPSKNSLNRLNEDDKESLQSKTPTFTAVNLLVVEDCPDTRDAIELILSHIGISCEFAPNGLECIRLVLAQEVRNIDYDLILIDLNLPDMDGCDIAAVLRKHGYQKPLVAITGTASLERQRASVHLGFDRFLAKRNFAETIIPTISELLMNEQKDLLL